MLVPRSNLGAGKRLSSNGHSLSIQTKCFRFLSLVSSVEIYIRVPTYKSMKYHLQVFIFILVLLIPNLPLFLFIFKM